MIEHNTEARTDCAELTGVESERRIMKYLCHMSDDDIINIKNYFDN